jgi:threonine/homoserine/homoserine lactone efflux protein
MTVETLLALTALAFASTWTPGPNNILLANSGAIFGFRPTLPHALGVALGFPLMLFLLSLGLGEAFARSEALREGLRWVGVVVLLWLGWRIATARRARGGAGRGRPFTFAEAAAFQWVNPKAWAMAVSTAAAFSTGAAPLREAALFAAVFVLSGLTSANGWAAFGAALRRALSSEPRLRAFNALMGGLIGLCALYLALAKF